MASTLAIVLPGARYTSLGPAIRFPVIALEQLGATVREVVYPEARSSSTFDESDWATFGAATRDQTYGFVADGEWDRVVFVAKSLGTGVLARIGPQLDVPNPSAIWLTPLFRNATDRNGAIAAGWPALLVAGTSDFAHDDAGFDQVTAALHAKTLLIDGADHGLEIPGDAAATASAMRRLVDATLAFADQAAGTTI